MDVSVVCGKYNQSILHVLLSAPARMEKVEETDIVKFEKCLAAVLKCDDGRLNPIINHKVEITLCSQRCDYSQKVRTLPALYYIKRVIMALKLFPFHS